MAAAAAAAAVAGGQAAVAGNHGAVADGQHQQVTIILWRLFQKARPFQDPEQFDAIIKWCIFWNSLNKKLLNSGQS